MTMEHRERQEYASEARETLDAHFLETIRSLPAGTPETFGATPLDFSSTHEQQRALQDTLLRLVKKSALSEVPEEIRSYCSDTFVSRFVGRGIANNENYLSALRKPAEVIHSLPMQDMVMRAETGHATPSELLVVRELLGIRSVELACLSHPYGANIDQLKSMRDAVYENIEYLGGVCDEAAEPRYRVKGFTGNKDGYPQGILMTRKRTIATMPDGTLVRERSSFILRCGQGTAVNIKTLRHIEHALGVLTKDTFEDPKWQDTAVEAARLDSIVSELLEDDRFTEAIPVSTTIYAFNEATTREINEMKQSQEQQGQAAGYKELKDHYPNLLAALQHAEEHRKARAEGRPTQNIGSMYFSGSMFEDED